MQTDLDKRQSSIHAQHRESVDNKACVADEVMHAERKLSQA